MAEFNPIPGRVLIVSGGVYKQADLCEYDGKIFAKYGQGHIALKANKETSKNRVFWKDLELKSKFVNQIGYLVLVQNAKAKAA